MPMQAIGIDVQLGATQRSFVRYLDVLFSQEAGVADLLLLNPIKVERFAHNATNVDPNTGTEVTGYSVIRVGDRARIDWGVNGITGNRTSNSGDGFYRVLVDGNADGDYLDAVDKYFEFARILGDASGDENVDLVDRGIVDAQLGRSGSNLNGDVDGSNTVNATDRSRVNSQISLVRRLADPLRPFLDD
jgi:hypothetical protein